MTDRSAGPSAQEHKPGRLSRLWRRRQLGRQEAEPIPASLAEMAERAQSLRDQAVVLHRQGRYEESRSLAEQVVGLYRQLAAQRPDPYVAYLGSALRNLSLGLAGCGRPEEALATAEEAVATLRPQDESLQDYCLTELGCALYLLAARLDDLDERKGEALHAAEEALAIRRRLALRSRTHLSDLAATYHFIVRLRLANGQHGQAVGALGEAVSIYRQLAQEQPEVYRPKLALTLYQLAAGLKEARLLTAALIAAEESAELYRPLAGDQPHVYQPDLDGVLRLAQWLESASAGQPRQ
ncbi:tetratricopeptide repeat protein [Streptomyces sp. NPDC053086]|uniref:tetratricopeptide repeat protein n=1 Tax=unclassified Streptomyces TaxID=2593676 RepID=UPI0037D53390